MAEAPHAANSTDARNKAAATHRGKPSLPDYLPIENLAIAMAAQKASIKPDQTGDELEAGTKKLYPSMLREAVSVFTWPVVAWKQKNNGTGGEWTVEDSSEMRPGVTKMWSRYLEQIKRPCKNDMSSALFRWYNGNGEKPSGIQSVHACVCARARDGVHAGVCMRICLHVCRSLSLRECVRACTLSVCT